MPSYEMTEADVCKFLRLVEAHNIEIILDGGWGVGALIGHPTRRHEDLDIALEHKDSPRLRSLMAEQGYTEVPRGDSWECNFVLGDPSGHLIDVHTYTFNAEGQNIFGVAYPLESLTGHGKIGGMAVRCIPPDWMVKFHSGYALDENDYRDVKALCQHFGLELPAEYLSFSQTEQEKRGSSKQAVPSHPAHP